MHIDYFDNEKDIVMLMEYCNDAKYFKNKIENVSRLMILTFGLTI